MDAGTRRFSGATVDHRSAVNADWPTISVAQLYMATKKFAFVVPHFGTNPEYLELAMYFVLNLRMHTKCDIVWMYSTYDTPAIFVETMTPLVTSVYGYNDDGLLVNIPNPHIGKYASFSILRACNFMFAFLLSNYAKVCIIESDIIITGNMFKLHTPAIVTYRSHRKPGEKPLLPTDNGMRHHLKARLAELADTNASDLNGGVILITPAPEQYIKCRNAAQVIIDMRFAYPNECLFQYVFNDHYNLPIIYNLSHYYAKTTDKMFNTKLSKVRAVHFNETSYKPISILKSPELAERFEHNRRYAVLAPIIEYFRINVFAIYNKDVDAALAFVAAEQAAQN
jgi:hypothetical protein